MLLLEDDPAFRRVLLELLEGEGLHVSICDTYAALRDFIREDRSVVVLADFWGTSHARLSPDERDEIRDLGRQSPTILLTGRAWAKDIDIADLHVICILSKPVELDDLVQQLQHCLELALDPEQ